MSRIGAIRSRPRTAATRAPARAVACRSIRSRRAALATAFGAAALLCHVGAVHAGTINPHLGRHTNCRFGGATTVLPHEYYASQGPFPRAIRDARARLFFYEDGASAYGSVYGCAYGVGYAVRLGPVAAGGSSGGGGIGGFALGGVFVVAESGEEGHPPGSEAVVPLSGGLAVFDLRNGHPVLRWRTRPPYTKVKSAVVTNRGAAAWIAYGYMGEWTLLASTPSGVARVLQSGAAASEPRSLSLAGDHLSWTSAGVAHSESLR
jgi:hypothetical protein